MAPDIKIPQRSKNNIWTNIVPILIVVGVIGFLTILIYGAFRGRSNQNIIGSRLPEFTLTTFTNETLGSEELLGKVVVINFWASWCDPCAEEADELQDAYEYFQTNPSVIFIGLAYNDVTSNSLEFIDRYQVSFPNAPDLAGRISAELGVTGVPETYIYSPSGELTVVQAGPYTSSAQIISIVEDLLDGEP